MATPPPNRTPPKHPRQPKGTPVSAQHYLSVGQIRDGVVVLRDGSLRAVVLVNAVNFALKSEEEQNALIFAYQNFVNSFAFPIQIVMQSRQLDLAHYIKRLDDQLAETTNELVQLQIADYIQFIQRLIQIANIMDKKFYVVVPFAAPSVRQRGLFDKLLNPRNRLEVRMSPAEFKSYRQELLERVRVIMGGLSGLGLRSALLGTQEVIELLYATHNPEEATKERLSDVQSITGSLVHAKPTERESKGEAQRATTEAVPASPLAEVVPEPTEPGINNQESTSAVVPPPAAVTTQPSAPSPEPQIPPLVVAPPVAASVQPPAPATEAPQPVALGTEPSAAPAGPAHPPESQEPA